MGNRAFIAPRGASIGVSLQWNGGRDSVEAFLKYAELSGLPGLGPHGEGLAGLTTIIANFFGNTGYSVYLEPCSALRPEDSDPGDNGVYVIDGFEIVARHGNDGVEQRQHDLKEMLRAIDAAQPIGGRVTTLLDAEEVPTRSLKIGDKGALPRRYDEDETTGKFRAYTVLGLGSGVCNGANVTGLPFVDMFDGQDNSRNPNSYIHKQVAYLVA